MSRGYNLAVIMGNVVRDPEIRAIKNDQKVGNITVAVSRKWKGKDGQTHEETDFIPVVMWGGIASVAEKYLRKGQPVLLEGRIQVRSYDKDGQKRYATEIVADDLTLLGRSSDNSGSAAAPAASAYPELEDTFPLDISDTLDPMADDFPFGNDPNA